MSELTESDLQNCRLKSCVERWPECYAGGWSPACCRFPKSCSPHGFIEAVQAGNLTADDLEEPTPLMEIVKDERRSYPIICSDCGARVGEPCLYGCPDLDSGEDYE